MRRYNPGAQGFFMLLKRMDTGEIVFKTEFPEASVLMDKFARRVFGAGVKAETRENRGVFTSRLTGKSDAVFSPPQYTTDRSCLKTRADIGAFLAGAFLCGGSITGPEKNCHLEFAARSGKTAGELFDLLENIIPGAKLRGRRGTVLVYYKDRSRICDLLTLMGATKASLALIDAEMIKEVRNRANRVTNCETANIDKTVSAAAGQIADITRIASSRGLDSLPPELRETAALRLENPDLSLRELAALHEIPPGRSVLHRRFERIAKIALDV